MKILVTIKRVPDPEPKGAKDGAGKDWTLASLRGGWVVNNGYTSMAFVDAEGGCTELAEWEEEELYVYGVATHPDDYYVANLFEALYGHRPFLGTDLAEVREAVLAGRRGDPPSIDHPARQLRRVRQLRLGLLGQPLRRGLVDHPAGLGRVARARAQPADQRARPRARRPRGSRWGSSTAG